MAIGMVQSKEYAEFLKESLRARKLTLYERACNFAEKTIQIPPWKELSDKYKEAIEFSHLKITPKGAFSLAIIITLIILLVPITLGLIFNLLSTGVFIMILIFTGLAFYYAYDYPMHYSIVFKIRASEEMVLSVIYMTISMRITPNIENAVKFAAENLSGPLALDLRQLMWDVYTRKFNTISEALDSFISKWKLENQEYTEAVYLIKTAVLEDPRRREHTMDEAVEVVLNGSKERMKHYAQQLTTPVTIINALGIVLPIIGLVFLPIIGIFLADLFQPVFIALSYNIILPFAVYWMMKSSLEKRPYSFHQPEITRHPQFTEEKSFNKMMLIYILIIFPTAFFGGFQFARETEPFSFNLLVSSLVVFCGIAGAISFHFIFTNYKLLRKRKEVVQIEGEFTEALFQLGKQLERGVPIEKALERLTANIKDLKISKMFEIILHNIRVFGMTFEQAVFDKNYGAIKFYPSRTITAIMKATVEISKRGMRVMSRAMISISTYLKGVDVVEEELKDLLAEVTSTMQIQALLLAPLTSGIVVALSAMIMRMMLSFRDILANMQEDMLASGPVGMAGGGILNSIINLDKMIPVHVFQLVVGIYMIQVVAMLAMFLSRIQFGEDNLMRDMNMGKIVLLASTIYVLVVVILYTTFHAIMPVMGESLV